MKHRVFGKFVRILLALAIGFLWSQAPTSAIASPATGDTPFDAIVLEDSGDTGSLGPGESRWYSFSQTAADGSLEVDVSVTLFFTPSSDQNIGRVNFQVFPAEQLSYWNEMGGKGGDTTKMVNLGAGGLVDRDSNPATVDLLWSGRIGSGVTYTVQVYNSAKEPIDYWLFPEDVKAVNLGPAASEAPAAAAAATGDTPFEALPLEESGDTGTLGPGESRWYSFSQTTADGSLEVDAHITLFFVPSTDQNIGRVNFQVFPAEQLSYWNEMGGKGGDTTKMVNLGAGGLVDRDSNPATVDLLWSGRIGSGVTYTVQVYNSAKEPIDYWLFPEDVKAVDLGPAASEAPAAAAAATGYTPFEALALEESGDAGTLGPGESRWYSFSQASADGSLEVDASITLFFVPSTDQNIGRVNFQVFPADQLSSWSGFGGTGGDSTEMVNLGAGGLVDRDSNPTTVDLLWSGRIGSGVTYYVQVYNSAKEPIDYWLFPEDVRAIDLGPASSEAAAAAAEETGDTPFEALTLERSGDTGTLGPGESRWYGFSQTAADGALEVDVNITLFFIPSTDQNIGRVNFQVFPADQLSSWSGYGGMGGDSTKMVNLGAGGLVERDSNPETVDLLWDAKVSSGVTYYVEVYNSAKEPIDYWLFPKDVRAVDLGQ